MTLASIDKSLETMRHVTVICHAVLAGRAARANSHACNHAERVHACISRYLRTPMGEEGMEMRDLIQRRGETNMKEIWAPLFGSS